MLLMHGRFRNRFGFGKLGTRLIGLIAVVCEVIENEWDRGKITHAMSSNDFASCLLHASIMYQLL